MKNSPEELNSISELAEEAGLLKTDQKKLSNLKKTKKKESSTMKEPQTKQHMCKGSPRRTGQRKWAKNIFEEIMADIFPNMKKNDTSRKFNEL